MSFKILIMAALLTVALAQEPTLTLPLYGLDPTQSLAASVIGVSNNATTLYLGCVPSPSNPEACAGFAYSRTLITGPSTYLLEVSEADLTSTQDCVSSTAYAVCEEYATSGDSYHYAGVATYPDAESFTIPVTAGNLEASATQTSADESPAATSSMETATMTSEAASEAATGAAAAKRGMGLELGSVAAGMLVALM